MSWLVSLICAGLLLILMFAFGMVSSVVVPQLAEMLHTSPHLAMLGFLGLVLAPAQVIALAHRLGSRSLDRLENVKPSKTGGAASAAAGAHGWLVMFGATVLTALVQLVIEPPVLEPEMMSVQGLADHLALAQVLDTRTGIWLTLAAIFFELQRRGRR